MQPDEIKTAALQLPKEQRADLAERLLDSLGESADTDVERLWIEEAERRLDEVQDGTVSLISGEEAWRRLRQALG